MGESQRPGERGSIGRAVDEGTALRSITAVGRLASLGTLAGGLVHEVNNPATFIALAGGQIDKSVTAALASGSVEGLEVVQELAAGIRESTQQIRDMVAAFRLLIGISHHAAVITVDLERVLVAAVELTRAAHRHDAVIQTVVEPMPPCPGRYLALGAVVVNVLSNAIESLRSTASPKVVRVEGRVDQETIHICIADTGEGITVDVLQRVFDPFFTTRDPERHAGLGLTVARESLARLGGEIRIQSTHGEGTKVDIAVPVRHESGDHPAAVT